MPLLNTALGGYMKNKRIRRIFKGAVAMIPGLVNLATNPSMEATSGTVEVRRNLATTPDGRTYVTVTGTNLGWNNTRWFGVAPGAGTHTNVTGASDGPLPGITSYARKTWTVAPPNAGDDGFETNPWTGFTPSAVYTVSAWIRTSVSHTNVGWDLNFRDATGVIQRTALSTVTTVAGVWTRFSAVVTVPPAGATTAVFYLDVDGPPIPTVGETIDVTGLLVEQVGAVGAVQRTNRHTNPSSGRASTNWSAQQGGGTFTSTRETTGGSVSATWYKMLNTVANTVADVGFNTTNINPGTTTGKIPVTGGATHNLSLYYISSITAQARIIWGWFDVDGVQIGSFNTGTYQTPVAGTWLRLSTGSVVAPANAAFLAVAVRTNAAIGAFAPGSYLGGNGVLVEQSGSLGSYFQGDGIGTLSGEYAWTGAPYASSSVFRSAPTGVLGPYFDGGYQQTPDSDLTNAWTGTANASASTLTGPGLAGYSTANVVLMKVFQSSQWASDRVKSLRLRSYYSAIDPGSCASPALPALTVGKTYTAIAKVRLEAPLVGAVRSERLCLQVRGLGGSVTALSNVPTNTAGVQEVRVTWVATAVTDLRMYHGGIAGSGDVWFDDLMLVEGTYTGGYKDGTFPGWGWDGTANASSSSGWN